jgi:hypothetical protein
MLFFKAGSLARLPRLGRVLLAGAVVVIGTLNVTTAQEKVIAVLGNVGAIRCASGWT